MLDRFKSYLESVKVTPISWLVGISGVLMVRFFLESLSNPTSSGYFASDASTLIHYYLFFMVGFMFLMVLLPLFLPEWKKAVPALVAYSSVTVLIAPIIDWVVSGGRGFKMTYLFDSPREMFFSFLTLGGLNISEGVTLGLKIEIGMALIIFALFIYFLKKSIKKALLYSFCIYFVAFALASLPGIVSIIGQIGSLVKVAPIPYLQELIANSASVSNHLHDTLKYSGYVRLFEVSFNFLMGKILFLICTVLLILWARTHHRNKFISILKNFRTERVSAYVVMIFLGIFISFQIFPVNMNWNDWLSVVVLCLSLIYSCLFAICMNDMNDTDTDLISNPNRPLISNSLDKSDLKQMGAISLTASLISAFLAGYLPFFFIMTFMALYYIYSVKPLRLKLIPIFSSFLISLCMLSVILSGFFLVSPTKLVSSIPTRLIPAVLIIFTLLANVRDMKDIAGDRAAGIKTVPVMLGDIWGPRIVALFAVSAFILIPIFTQVYILLLPALPTAFYSWKLINKKPYSEKSLDRIYFSFMFLSFLLLLI